jgi:hypothetical protein
MSISPFLIISMQILSDYYTEFYGSFSEVRGGSKAWNTAVYSLRLGENLQKKKEEQSMEEKETDTVVYLVVTGYCYMVVPHKASHALQPFLSIGRPHLTSNHFWFINQCSMVAAEISSSKARSWQEMSLNLADVVSLSYYAGIFNML